jgi:hypothetical protein
LLCILNFAYKTEYLIRFFYKVRTYKKKIRHTMRNFEISYVRNITQKLKYDTEKKVVVWIDNEDMQTQVPLDSRDMPDQFLYWLPYFTMEYFEKHGLMCSFQEETLNNFTHYLKYHEFNPLHMTTVEMRGLTPKKMLLYDRPKQRVEVPLIILYVDGLRYICSEEFTSGMLKCYGSLNNTPFSITTGVLDCGYLQNLIKMSMNKVTTGPLITQRLVFAAILRTLHEVGHTEEDRLGYERPNPEILTSVIEKYSTSVGESPFSNCILMNTTTGETKTVRNPPTKKSMAHDVTDFMLRFLDELEEQARKGNVYNKVFPGESVCRESRKQEILNGLEAMSYEDLVAMHEKVRLFYLEPVHFTMLSNVFLRGIFAFLKTCNFVIGTSLNDGEFLKIWRYHECNEEEHEMAYSDFPELRAREYGEADASRFDQSQVYKLLYAVGIFFCCFYKYDEDIMKVIMSDIVFRLCAKFLYLVGINEVKYVLGMMFSGKFETSHGNTAYQNLIFQMYLTHLLEKWKDHPKNFLLVLSIRYGLITGSFSGDDMFLGWPKLLRQLFNVGIDDYRSFSEECGITFKYCKTKPLYGIVKFEKIINGGYSFFKEVSVIKGIVFLKNQMSHIYHDGIFQGIYPYRPFSDLVFRIGNSDKANQYLDTFKAKLLSLAYLSVGNSEFYDYLSAVYVEFNRRNPGLLITKEICQYIAKGSMSMYYFVSQLDSIDMEDPFPTLDMLRSQHDKALIHPRPSVQSFNIYNSVTRMF